MFQIHFLLTNQLNLIILITQNKLMDTQNPYNLLLSFNFQNLQESLMHNFNKLSAMILLSNQEIQKLKQTIRSQKDMNESQVYSKQLQNKSDVQVDSGAKEEINDKNISKSNRNNSEYNNVTLNYSRDDIEQNPQKQQHTSITHIQNKIFEMNQRMISMQEQLSKNIRINTSKFRQIACELQSYQRAIQKNSGFTKMYENEVQKLRSEIMQYKLKKQNKLMKIMSQQSKGDGKGVNNNQTSFIIDKIHYISKYMNTLVQKQKMDSIIQQLSNKIELIKNSMKKCINIDELQTSIAMLQKKIIHAIPNHKQHPTSQNQNERQKATILNDDFIKKIYENQQKIFKIQDNIQQLQTFNDKQQKISKQNYRELLLKCSYNQQLINKLEYSMTTHEQFMQDMNKSYNSKFFQAENQIIQIQQSLTKLTNQIKYIQHTGTSKVNHQQHNSQPQIRNIQMQNDVMQLKKKINKINLKLQNLKEDNVQIRQDFSKDIDIVKNDLEKKADLQSLKKGLSFYEEKIKLLSTLNFQHQQTHQLSQGILSKKGGWSCLCCNKDVNISEERLINEKKMKSNFPKRHESPRLGPYFKQKQMQRQYKALFLSKQSKIRRGSKQQLYQ